MKSKWVVFQTHTITLSNSNVLLLQSHFLTEVIKFVKYKEKYRIYLSLLPCFPSPPISNSKQISWLTVLALKLWRCLKIHLTDSEKHGVQYTNRAISNTLYEFYGHSLCLVKQEKKQLQSWFQPESYKDLSIY